MPITDELVEWPRSVAVSKAGSHERPPGDAKRLLEIARPIDDFSLS